VDKLTIIQSGQQRKDWRLCLSSAEDDVSDEVVVRIQGILTKNNLVPRNAQTRHAEICGMGTRTFEESLNQIPAVVDIFEQHLAGAELGSIAEADSAGGRLFVASNRLFTIRSDAPTEQDNRFQSGVDPLNILQKLKSNQLIHAPENIVRF
ncbi:hypothetical protein FB451DRAFT_979998, partial [Mycena latifolia]